MNLLLAAFWRRNAVWMPCMLQALFCFPWILLQYQCLWAKSVCPWLPDPASGGDVPFTAFEPHEEHLASLFLANIPMVFVFVYRLHCPKRKFSYVGNGPQMKACSRFLAFVLRTVNRQREIQTHSSVMFIAEQPLISKFQPCAAIYNDTRPVLPQCPESLLKNTEVGLICINFRHSEMLLDSVEDYLLS